MKTLKRIIDRALRFLRLKKVKVEILPNVYLSKAEAEDLDTIGLVPKAVSLISVHQLRVQFDPALKHIIEKYFFNLNKEMDLSIQYSPLVKLLQDYQIHGQTWLNNNYQNSLYYQYFHELQTSIGKINYFTEERIPFKFSDEAILKKINKFIRLFHSIEENGYLARPYETRWITVVSDIFVNRFIKKSSALSQKPAPVDWEIFGGHHRAASLYVLGKREIPVLILEDRKREQHSNE